MHILNNSSDQNYWESYPNIENVIFDISEEQLKNKKNKDWFTIQEGSLVCVILSSKKVSTFYRVDSIIETDLDNVDGVSYALIGEVVAKSDDREDVTRLFNKYNIVHECLPKNKIGVAFNVADIANGLDKLLVKVADGSTKPLADVK